MWWRGCGVCVRTQISLTRWNKSLRFAAAKRRKNAAHGASRGGKWETDKPPTGRKKSSQDARWPAKTGQSPVTTQGRGYLGNFTDWRPFLLGGFHQVGEGEGPFLRARLGCGDLQHSSINLELILWQSVTADVENHHLEITKVRLVHMHRWIWLFSPKPDPPRVPRRSPAAHEIWLLPGS